MIQPWKGKWILGNRIGKGGQGLTYYAKPISDNESKFAIKFLKEQKNLERRERMYVEISALSILEHPHIPKLIDHNAESYKEIDTEMYMVSNYVVGSTLQEYIEREGVLDLQTSLTITISLADTLTYCHKKGFVHRDIKPDNIILENDNSENPILIDFGLSFNMDIDLEKSITPSWQHIGNRFLSLPELRISESNKRDYRSDVTMICGILFFCLTGLYPTDLLDENSNKPHRRKKSLEILGKIEIDKLTILNNIFDIGFNFSINDRWQTIESLRLTLIDLHYLKIKENNNEDINSRIERFKKRIEERVDYRQSQTLEQIFNTCDKVIAASEQDVELKLQPIEFKKVQSGYSRDYTKQIFINTLGLQHPYNDKIFFFPKFTMYITGSEIVLEGIEDNNRTELLRNPLNEQIDWKGLRVKIANYYINGIIEKEK